MEPEVRVTEEGLWGLFLNGVLLGTSKQRYDADHAKQVLLRWRNSSMMELK